MSETTAASTEIRIERRNPVGELIETTTIGPDGTEYTEIPEGS